MQIDHLLCNRILHHYQSTQINNHKLCKLSSWVEITAITHAVVPLYRITLKRNIMKFLDNLIKILETDCSNGKLFLFYIFDLLMALIPIEVINPLIHLPKYSFGSKDVILSYPYHQTSKICPRRHTAHHS